MLNHLEHQPQATSNSPHVRVRHAAVLGGGAWGTALAQMLARGGSQVVLQAMEKEVVDAVNTVHENTTFLKGAKLSPDVRAVQSVKEAVDGAEVVLLVVPTPFIRSFAVKNRDVLPVGVPLVCCSKGIEQNTLLTPFEILEDELPGKYHPHIAVLSGPSFAREVAENRPTCVAVASKRPELTSFLQQSISSKNFRIYMSNDPMGLELCGALKNVYAVVSGAVDEMNLGLNTRAAIITRGLAELAQLAVIKGASPLTVAGLGGVGDLVLTCTGSLSRNWQVGSRLAKGERMEEIIKSMKQVAEGVHTAKAIHQLAERYHVDMPIAEMIYKVLYEGMELRPALEALFESEPHIAELSFESLEKVKEEHNSKRKQSLVGGGGSGVSNRGSVPTTPSRQSQSEHISLQ